jgi:glycogen(starch) synthase
MVSERTGPRPDWIQTSIDPILYGQGEVRASGCLAPVRWHMNIGILSYEYPPETGFGGIGTYSYYHARALVKLGHRVHVFAGSTRPGLFHSDHDGLRVTRVKKEGWLHRLLEPARARKCFWFHNRVETAYAMYIAVRHALEREAFDIIEAPECGADAALVSTLLDVPVAIRFHSPARLIMDMYQTPKLDRELTAFVEHIAINRASVRTACSHFVADEVETKMRVSPPIHVIPNGIDINEFDRSEASTINRRSGLPKDALTVVFANRMEERKGIHLIVDIAVPVMKRHRTVHFVLAGRDLFGYVADRVLPRIREEGLEDRFHVLGGLDLPEVRTLVKRCDIVLLPSLWENCPYSCIEAMAAGRAIVSSDCGGMPELIVDHENGALATTGDAQSFVMRLEQLIADRNLRERLGAAARRTVEQRLTDVEIARRTADLYSATLAIGPSDAVSAGGVTALVENRRR